VDGDNTHLAVLGGGPCHAVHPSDPAVALTALDAVIHVDGSNGKRAIPIGDFFVLPAADPRREQVLEAGEIVAAVEIPGSAAGGRQWFTKVLQRGAWDFALASIAAVKRTDGGVRLVLGGVAAVPWRINPSVEEDVASAPLADDDLDTLAARALHDARALSQNGYKIRLAHGLLREGIAFVAAP
jgi:xanthine dehydrogenase YagS FAD-binding subunit